MNRSYVIAAAIGGMFWATSVMASPVVEVSATRGKVLVNQGNGFEVITGSRLLNAGDRVMVGGESSALISYLLSNCRVTAAPSSIVTISGTAPCKAGEAIGMTDSVFIHPAAADNDDENDTRIFRHLIVGGMVIGAGVALFDILDDDNKDSDDGPVSAF